MLERCGWDTKMDPKVHCSIWSSDLVRSGAHFGSSSSQSGIVSPEFLQSLSSFVSGYRRGNFSPVAEVPHDFIA